MRHSTPVLSSTKETGPERDFTIKVLATGLSPGRTYYYRFVAGDAISMIGRTVPSPRALWIAHAGHRLLFKLRGHFNGYDAIARDEQVDFVLHLGDYL